MAKKMTLRYKESYFMPMQNKIKEFVDGRGMTPYAFWKETKIAKRTAYDLYNKPDHLPSIRTLEQIMDTYKEEPNTFICRVEKV